MISHLSPMLLAGLFVAAFIAGVQNALAGGGSFITFPALLLTGLDARAANITSTIALFPGQCTTGWMGRRLAAGAGALSLRMLFGISLVGGAVGALLLLATPPAFFEHLVPWLILFATAVFAWGSFVRRPTDTTSHLGPVPAAVMQFLISIYGGYFGGGIGFMMLAALTLAGVAVRAAGGTKNMLAAAMNASAVGIFLFSSDVGWVQAAVVAVAAVLGGVLGGALLKRVNERALRVVVVAIGVALTICMFIRQD